MTDKFLLQKCIPDRQRWHLMLLPMVSPFLPVVKLLSGSTPCGFCRWDMLRPFQRLPLGECFNGSNRRKMMEQSRRDSNRFIFVFLTGEGGRLRHSWFSKQTTLVVCDCKSHLFLNCLTTTCITQSLLDSETPTNPHADASLSRRLCEIQMALQSGHDFSRLGTITASDLFQDLIANWMLEVWPASKFLPCVPCKVDNLFPWNH